MLRHRIAAAVLASSLVLGAAVLPSPAGALEGCELVGQVYRNDAGEAIITNPVVDIGCVVTAHGGTTIQTTRFVAAYAEPGWTYTVKSDGSGTSARVVVEFRNRDTGVKYVFKIEPGRVKVR